MVKDVLKEIEDSKVMSGKTMVWFLGGASIAIKTREALLYIDPYFGPSPDSEWVRRFPPPIDPGKIKIVDGILITHEHEDHCDMTTLQAVTRNTDATIYASPNALTCIKDGFKINIDTGSLKEIKPGDSFTLKDVDIFAQKSSDPQSPDAITYILQTEAGTIFHSGDSHYSDIFKDISSKYRIDVAFLNLGNNPPGEYYYLTPRDFEKVAKELRARLYVPIHWDIWNKTYLDPQTCVDGWSGIKVKVMKSGEKLELPI